MITRIAPVCIGLAAAIAILTPARLPAASKAPPAIEILKKAVRAPLNTSYRASETVTFTVGRSRSQQRIVTVHRAPDRTKWSYVDDGKVERIVSDNRASHWQYITRPRQLIFSPSLPIDRQSWQERDLVQLIANYKVAMTGVETLSGRRCYILSVTPLPGHTGPGKRVWVDTATSLMLRSESSSADGRTRVNDVLSGLKIEKNVPASEFLPPPNVNKQSIIYEQAAVLPVKSLARQWKHPLLIPGGVPKGYSLESARIVRRGKLSFVHFRYYDGRASVSLFQEPSTNRSPDVKGDRIHGSIAEWRVDPPYTSVSWRERGVKLTLMGDLPRNALLDMARSVKPQPK